MDNELNSDRSNALAPRFLSGDELVPRIRRPAKRLWLWAVIVALVLLTRAGGVYDFYLNGFDADTKVHLTLNENGFHWQGDRLLKTNHWKDFHQTTRIKQWGVSLPWFRAPELSVDLAKEIQQQLRNDTKLNIQIQSIELEGLYWLPLYKSGSCSYRLTIQAIDQHSISYVGELNGKTDFSVVGISSVRGLKHSVADEIANRIRQVVREAVNQDAH